jgi:hypothetical protein
LAVRQLYTDDEEVLFQAARPTLINGIEDVISRPDLADRAIFLTMPLIAEKERRPRADAASDLGRPPPPCRTWPESNSRLRGELLPRMPDFALWAAACETALWPVGTVARAYAANRQAAIKSVVEADPVAVCVRDMMARRQQGSGTASDFLRAADMHQRDEVSLRRAEWPRTPRALAGRLRRRKLAASHRHSH